MFIREFHAPNSLRVHLEVACPWGPPGRGPVEALEAEASKIPVIW